MQYAIILTGLTATVCAFNFPQLKQLEQRQAGTAVSTGPSTTILTTVTTCPYSSTVTSGSSTFIKTGNVTSTIIRTVCPSSTQSKKPKATGASVSGKYPVFPNATAYYPTGKYGTAAVPVATGSVSLQQQINNYLNAKGSLTLQQRQQQFQQLSANLQGLNSLSQQQQSFFTSESKQLFGETKTVSSGSQASLAAGEIFVSGSQTLINTPQATPLPPVEGQEPEVSFFQGAGTKTTITTGSALLVAVAVAFGF